MYKLLLCACAALALGACATDPVTSADDGYNKEYRTGSNIPARQREGVTTVSPEELERQRAASSGNTGRRPGN